MRTGGRYRKLGSIFVLAWLLIVSIISFLPAWSQTTQTITFNPIADAYVDADNPSTNYGSSNILKLDNNPERGAYIKFNLSSFTLPVNHIVSAKLKVYYLQKYEACGGPKIEVYHVSDDSWEESVITYNNKPSIGSKIGESQSIYDEQNMFFEITIDITSYISENDKILSLYLTRACGSEIASRDYAESDKWPQLIIEYEPYTETTTQTITETITVTETITETATETQTVTETQTITETQTTYTTSTDTITQTITNAVTETATTTITETSTVWANQTVTVTTTITPTVTETVTASYGNQTANYYVDLTNQLIPLIMVIGVICSLLGLLLSATSGKR